LGWDELANNVSVAKTMDSLKSRNISVELLKDRREALRRVTELLPMGTEIMIGNSNTLSEIGLLDLINTWTEGWRNLKDTMIGIADFMKRYELRVNFSRPLLSW